MCPKQANTPKKKPSNGRTRWRKPVNRAPLPVPSSRRTPREKTGSGNEGVLTGISDRRTADHLRSFSLRLGRLSQLSGRANLHIFASMRRLPTSTHRTRTPRLRRRADSIAREVSCPPHRLPTPGGAPSGPSPGFAVVPGLEASGNSSSRTPYSWSSRRLL